jgi:glycosyltransferase involved in cell wall biosynthesis
MKGLLEPAHGMRIAWFGRMAVSSDPARNALTFRTWRFLADQIGASVEMFLVSDDDERHTLADPPVVLHLIPAARNRLLASMSYVPRALRAAASEFEEAPDLIVGGDAALGGFSACRAAGRWGAPLLIELQGNLFEPPPQAFSLPKRIVLRMLAQTTCRRADVVRCVSEATRRAAVAHGIAPGKLVVVRPRVDLGVFDPRRLAEERERTRAALGLSPSDVVVVFSGSMTSRKGVDLLVDAFVSARRQVESLRLLIIGGGPLEAETRRRIQAEELTPSVHITGWLDHDEVAAHMACGDVFTLLSWGEGLPRVILEASALEMPIIASSVDGIPEAVSDGTTGFLVAPGDVSKASAHMVRLGRDPDLRARMGTAGRARMTTEFDFEVSLKRYASIIRDLAQGRTS